MAIGYVRAARTEDAAEIARIQIATWRGAYSKIVPQSVLDSLDEQWHEEQWRQACTEPPTAMHKVLIAIEQSETDQSNIQTVGFAALGPDTADDSDEDSNGDGILISELLVEPRFGRRGHGSRLLSAAIAHCRNYEFDTANAWVFVRDSASLNFYKSAGWEPDGYRRTLDMNGTIVPQLRLHVDISDSSGDEQA